MPVLPINFLTEVVIVAVALSKVAALSAPATTGGDPRRGARCGANVVGVASGDGVVAELSGGASPPWLTSSAAAVVADALAVVLVVVSGAPWLMGTTLPYRPDPVLGGSGMTFRCAQHTNVRCVNVR